MVTLKHVDTVQNRVVFNLDVGSETIATVREIGSLIKQEIKLSPLIDDSDIFEWTGLDPLDGGNATGIVMILRPGWTIWTEDAISKHRFRITEGIVLGNGGADPLGTPTNVIWSLAEYTVSSILGSATVDDIATLLTKITSLETEIRDVRRFLGIKTKRYFDGSDLVITEEDKVTEAMRFNIDSTTAPTSQVDTI